MNFIIKKIFVVQLVNYLFFNFEWNIILVSFIKIIIWILTDILYFNSKINRMTTTHNYNEVINEIIDGILKSYFSLFIDG